MGVIGSEAPDQTQGEDVFCVQKPVKEVRPELNREGHMQMTWRRKRTRVLSRWSS